MFCFPFFVEV